jgi:hypothetical protein
MRNIILITLIILASNISFATSYDTVLAKKVFANLKLEKTDCFERLITHKDIPNSSKEAIVVIPKIAEHGEGYLVLDSYIVIVNKFTGEIISRYFEEKAWHSDAVYLESIEIDTAPFLVHKNYSAFGLRLNYYVRSRAKIYSSTGLSLFIKNDKKIENILKNFAVKLTRGESDTNCNAYIEEHHRILIVSKNKTNDFFDILVKDSITKTTTEEVDGDCKDTKVEKSKESALLKFIDGKYSKQNN